MKTTSLLTLGALFGTLAFAVAQETETAPEKPKHERKVSAEDLQKYDKDGDGKLSDDEKKALKKDRKKEQLEKYDTDKDGKLSDTEKEAMKADRKAHKGGEKAEEKPADEKSE
ncbi:MAG: hypothetical protein QM680_11585 [Luteolibacter sp.]